MSFDLTSHNPTVVARRPVFDAKIYDLLACSPIIVWYGLAVTRQFPELVHDLAAVLFTQQHLMAAIDALSKLAIFLFAAALILMLVARRPASAKAQGFLPRATALLGCYLGVGILVLPRQPIGWELKTLSTLLILGGTAFALAGLLWLGRSFSILSEARKLVVGGPYAIVRHPLYLGEQAALIGVMLQYLSFSALALLALQFAFQLYRMGFEEKILTKTFPDYAAYKQNTARLIPGIY